MKKTILITGVKGFLASNLIDLLKDDYALFGIGKQAEISNGIQIFSSAQIEEITINPDFILVCHAAVSSGNSVASNKELFEVNVAITEQLVQKFSSSKIIYISTASIYDVDCALIKEDSPIDPQSEYAVSKFWAERIVAKTQNAVIIRLSSLFGSGMKENTIIPNYTNQALQKGEIEIWGNGERKQNYISVSDACQFIIRAVEAFDVVKNKILLGVSKIEYSNIDLAKIIAEATNAKMTFVNQDNSKSLQYNNDLSCQLIGWSPSSNFADEIQKYIQWKRKQS